MGVLGVEACFIKGLREIGFCCLGWYAIQSPDLFYTVFYCFLTPMGLGIVLGML